MELVYKTTGNQCIGCPNTPSVAQLNHSKARSASQAERIASNVTHCSPLHCELQHLHFDSFQTPLCLHNGLIQTQRENTSGLL